jgi:flavin reductase (DIM6/NTAB) family NADH-FMN oxidoreductase RutF
MVPPGKSKLSTNVCLYPMPVTLVGADVGGKANFSTVSWVNRVNFQPPIMMVAVGRPHLTHQAITEAKVFSINVPGVGLLQKVDYCGLISGRRVDKSRLFEVYYGELPGAPLIRECPLAIACRVVQTVDLTTNTLFLGEVVEVLADDKCLTGKQLDPRKLEPFVLTMPDNGYWALGERVGTAWADGQKAKGG